ncbi:MAG: GNAT family N-acetyltransferase [Syntrophales bacterium]|jgi:ribosomal protein S18 acetylase RimI-like enzyme
MINVVLKIQENLTLLRIYRVLSSVIQLIPYYITEEFYIEQQKLNVSLEEDSKISILTRDDMELLGNHEESEATTKELIHLLDSGCLCLAVKYKDEIAAYSWCDPNYVRYKGRIVALKRNEAYLFQARTYKAFRGKNLAPYVRNELCKLLKQRGVERFFSITLWSNTAAMKFKQKLGAKPIELFLYVALFRKFKMHFRLRNMAHLQ